MPTTYSEANEETIGLMEDVIAQYFGDLCRCEPPLRIAVLMAENEKGDALKKYGTGIVAMIKRATPEDKAEGGPDLRILIDAMKWADAGDRRRRAILAHELRHIAIQWAAGGKLSKLDDYGRPKVKLVPDDWHLTGFRDVVAWFGDDAVERWALTRVEELLRQATLPFRDEDESADEPGLIAGSIPGLDRAAEAGRRRAKAAGGGLAR